MVSPFNNSSTTSTSTTTTAQPPFEPKGLYWESYSIDLWAYIYVLPDKLIDPKEEDLSGLAEQELDSHTTGGTQKIYVPIVSISSHFALNSIPTATVTTAVGRNVSNDAPAGIHEVIDLLTTQKAPTPIKVYALIKNMDREVPTNEEDDGDYVTKWPKKPFTVFDGYVVGYSVDTTTNSNRIVLQCAHWLVDLAFSSAVSRTSIPSNPAHISFNTAGFSGSSTVPENKYYSSSMPGLYISTQTAKDDVWGGGIATFFQVLSEQDRFGLSINNFIQPLLSNKNYEAIRALKLFEDGGPSESYTTPEGTVKPRLGKPYKYGVPAKINLKNTETVGLDVICAKITEQLVASSTPVSMATVSLWDKLIVDYCGSIMLAVVPMIQRALVVPYLPTSKEEYKYLRAYEIQGISSQISIVRPIRGVAVHTTGASSAGGQSFSNRPGDDSNNSFDTAFVGGYYESDDFPSGQVIVKGAPPWLTSIIATPETGSRTVPSPPSAPIGTASSPGSGKEVEDEAKKPATISYVKTIADDIAKLFYSFERLANRQMIVKTGLRFDIAPGTSMLVEIPEDNFLLDAQDKPREPKWLFGSVNRVSFMIDAEQGQASTTLNLSHVRDYKENQKLGSDSHPIYEKYYKGGPLVTWIKPEL